MSMLHQKDIIPLDPVLFSLGPISIKWYSLAYIIGIIGACFYMTWLNNKDGKVKNFRPFDDLLIWIVLGVVIGGRLGYVIFYNPQYFLFNPVAILKTWEGGMSFHGGLLGVIIAVMLYAKSTKNNFFAIMDLGACAATIGLFFGRLANFINGELYGRPADVPWAVVFPQGGVLARHPSQLYEAILEGLLLGLILFILARYTKLRQSPGVLSGIFLIGYGMSRIIVENYREPDEHIGFIISNITLGQILSLPMIILGILIALYGFNKSKT